MPRNKRFKVAPAVTEKSTAAMPQAHTRACPIPSEERAEIGAHLAPPARSDARSFPASNVGVHPRPQIGSRSRLSAPTEIGASSMPYTHRAPSHHLHDQEIEPEDDLLDEDVGSFDEHVDDLFAASGDTTSSGSRKKSYWVVNVVDELDDTTKEARYMVQDVWSIPDSRKIIVLCNEYGQAIGDAGGLLGGFLGLLGSDFNKFPICYTSWRKVPKSYKDTVYNDIIQKKFHIVDNQLKNNIMKRIGKAWKDTRYTLFHEFYNCTLSMEENIAKRPSGIDENHWRWFIEYRLNEKTQDMCKKNAENRKKQLYTHTGGSKTIARRKHEEERQRGSSISRGELWVMLHKKKDGSFIHDDAQVIGEKIMNIEREDNSSKGFSQNDSLSQAIGKEHSGRVRGVGSGPCPTQVFGQTTCSNASVDRGFQIDMNEMKSELEASRLRVQNLESIIEAERLRRQAIEGAVKYMLQMQGSNLPPELTALINVMAPDEGSGPISPGVRPSSSASHDARYHDDHSNQSGK